MKLALGIAAIVATCLLLWVISPFSPDHRQPEPAIEAVENGHSKKNWSEHAIRPETSTEAASPSLAAARRLSEGSGGTWGELVEFHFAMEGCDTETIGVNSQIPCESRIVADHPYEQFSDAQLRQIANTDGIAALILGARLGYRRTSAEALRESISLLHAAVALTGHVDALNMLMTQLNVTRATQYVNGEVDIGQASKSYVYHKAGNNLGLVPDEVLEEVAKPLLNNAAIDLAALNMAAEERTEWFSVRRQQLTGETF